MKPTLASIRARAMKRGKTLPIWTEEEWSLHKEERKKPLDLQPLLDAHAQFVGTGGRISKDSSWAFEGTDAHYG